MSTSRKQTRTSHPSGPLADSVADQRQLVAMAAYFRAEARGFEPGHELEDWLAAEQEITQQTTLVRH